MIAWVFVWRFYIIPPQGRPQLERLLAAILVPILVGKRRAHKARHPRTGEAIRVCNPTPSVSILATFDPPPAFGQRKGSPEICNLDPAEDHPSASKCVHPRELPLL